MFGIVKPCRHQLSAELHREWMGHLCGLCLTLRDHHGQATRVTTNTDAVVLSVLVDAQRPAGVDTTTAAPCALRGFRRARVVSSAEPAAIHAAGVSLTMAATKVEDHVLDREGMAGHLPGASGIGRRWAAQGDDLSDLVGFASETIREAVARSNAVEAAGPRSFDEAARPTEDAAAAAFVHTAVLAGCPDNAAALDTIGRCFGRIVYLLDAFEDADDDVAHGRYNALVASAPDLHERRREASRHFSETLATLVEAFDSLSLARPTLARALLVGQVRAAGHRVLHVDHGMGCDHRHRDPATGLAAGTARVRTTSRDVVAAGRMVGRVGAAAALALAATSGVFRPENPQEPPFDPNQGQFPGQPYPGQPYPGDPASLEEQQRRMQPGADPGSRFSEDASDCFCDGCCCCACDGCCDCCNCCDCS